MNHPIAIAAALLLGDAALVDASNALKEPPAYKMFRATEDYRYLASEDEHKFIADWFDPIKYIALNAGQDIYLTLGGEFRPRFEHFTHRNWSATVSFGSVAVAQQFIT